MRRFGGQRTGKPGRGNGFRRGPSKNEKKKKNIEDYVYYVGQINRRQILKRLTNL